MIELILASNNNNKVVEIKQIMPQNYSILTMKEKGFEYDIPEDQETLEGNAIQKAKFIHNKLKCNVISDDTGLIIPSLNGEPGVYSARYAGPDKNALNNMDLVLNKMKGINNRVAYFETVIALIYNNKTYTFSGKVHGTISEIKIGENGFGYDPIFIPDGQGLSFAQMSNIDKNNISHRKNAIVKLVDFFKTIS
jgi:XTP/dITP diphosphohydrolase